MLVDAASLPDPMPPLLCEVCIVGGGPAGIAVALELLDRDLRVVLLESGGDGPDPAAQALNEGESSGHLYFPLVASRLRGLGGTSNHWQGWCRPFEAEDFERRAWIPESGWPLAFEDLAPAYARARELCELGAPRFEPEDWPPAERARRLPLEPARAASVAIQLSPPTRFGAVYRERLHRAANLRLLLGATATELVEASDGGRIDALHARTLAGRGLEVRARHFVVAAGGIENPRLLLASHGRSERGVGNHHDLVGRYFMEHPHVDTARFLPSDPELDLGLYHAHAVGAERIQGILVLPRAQREREALGGFAASFEPATVAASRGYESLRVLVRALRNGQLPDAWSDHLWRVASDIDEVSEAVLRRWRGAPASERFQRLALHTEQIPNRESRVELADERDVLGMPKARLVWRLSEQDERTLRRGRELLAAELARAALGRVQIPEDEEDRVGDYALGGHHHMGTTRMAGDPSRGVVDADCRVHGVENLHMAGSSVFATGGFANPTLTLVALAVRLGARLRGELA